MITGKEQLQEAMVEAYSLEKGMREFYRYADSQAQSDQARDLYRMLRDWEDRHMKYVESLYVALMDDRELHSYEVFSEQVQAEHIESGMPAAEARSMLDERQPSGDMEIIDFALEMEEKAHRFYAGLSRSAEDSNVRIVFEEMMVQEQKHIDGLKSLRTLLAS